MDIQQTPPSVQIQNTGVVQQAPADSVNRLMNSSNSFIAKMTTPSNKFIASLKNPKIAPAGSISATNQNSSVSTNGKTYMDKKRGLTLSEDDINEAKAVMYGEVGSRSRDKKVLEANVVLNTALNRLKMIHDSGYKNVTLKDVLSEPKQYQAFGGNNYNLAKSGKVDPMKDERMGAINEVIDKMNLGQLEDISEGRVRYHHYDDPKTKERKIKLSKYKKAWSSGGKVYTD